LTIKDNVISSINTKLSSGFTLFLAIKLLNTILIALSVVGVIIYYKYIFNNYIMEVLKMYENIRVDQIKLYQEKCHKYKISLTAKSDSNEKSGE
jgi:hypothetical protein